MTDSGERARELLANATPLLERMLMTLDVGVAVFDAAASERVITYVNPAFERLTGYSAREALGQRCGFLQGADTDPSASAEIQAALEAGRPISTTILNYRRDGSPFWCEIRIEPVPGADGEAAFFLALLVDATERIEAEARLNEAEERYRSLIERLPMATYVAHRTDRTRLTYMSPQIETMTGYPPGEWLGDSDLWRRMLHPDDLERVIEEARGRIHGEGSGVADMEYRLLAPNGDVVWIRDQGTYRRIEDSDGIVIEGVLQDVTTLRRAQLELEQTTELHSSMFNAMSEGIVVVDEERRILTFNAAAERILGVSAEEFEDVDWWQRLTPRHPSGEEVVVEGGLGAEVMRTGEAILDKHLGFTDEHGEQRWLSVNYEPLAGGEHHAPRGLVLSFHDVTDRWRADEDLKMFASLVELSSDFVALAGLDGSVLYLNEAGRRLVGLGDLEEVRGKAIVDFLTEEGRLASERVEQPAVVEHGRWEGESTLRHFGTGAEIDVRISSFLVKHPETGEPWALATVQRDITAEKAAQRETQASRARYEAQFRGLPVPTYAWQRRGDDLILFDSNDAAREATEGQITEMFGMSADELYAGDPEIRLDLERCFSTGRSITRDMRYRMRTTDEEQDLVVTHVFIPPDIVLTHTLDVTERVAYEGKLRELAEHDSLTGLYNRRRFEALLGAQVASDDGAVVLVDIDHFKFVNDSLGHAAGDELLRAVAANLDDSVRPGDCVARLGGDEFAVLLADVDEDTARSVAGHLLTAARSTATAVAVTVSAGVAAFKAGELSNPLDALVAADIALYQAKEAGRDRVAVFGGKPGETLTWIDRVRTAIDEKRLTLFAQPIIALPTGETLMEELLVRMIDEDGAIISPTSFLPTAEQFGLIREIDRWVIRKGIERAATGHRVNINLSARSLSDPDLVGIIEKLLREGGVSPDQVGFEYTETAAVSSVEDARKFTEGLNGLGCEVALDDFGTGFGSFVLLKHLPISTMKIDIEFVRGLSTSEADRRIVRSIVHIATESGLKVVAEGVEDEGALALLRGYGVDQAQGYFIGRPAPIEV